MGNHFFISYSSLDVAKAIKLADQLTAGPPSIEVWLDKRKIQPGIDWGPQIAQALRTCAGILYLVTEDSVSDTSECQQEWQLALTCKKPIIPLLFEKSAKLPYRLAPRQYIDFVDNFEVGLAKLREHLRWRGTDEGTLHTLKERLEDAKRGLKRASEEEEAARIRKEIDELNQQIKQQQAIITDPEAATQKTEAHIESAPERDHQPPEAAPAEHLKPIRSPLSPNFMGQKPVFFEPDAQVLRVRKESQLRMLLKRSQREIFLIGIAFILVILDLEKAFENGVALTITLIIPFYLVMLALFFAAFQYQYNFDQYNFACNNAFCRSHTTVIMARIAFDLVLVFLCLGLVYTITVLHYRGAYS